MSKTLGSESNCVKDLHEMDVTATVDTINSLALIEIIENEARRSVRSAATQARPSSVSSLYRKRHVEANTTGECRNSHESNKHHI